MSPRAQSRGSKKGFDYAQPPKHGNSAQPPKHGNSAQPPEHGDSAQQSKAETHRSNCIPILTRYCSLPSTCFNSATGTSSTFPFALKTGSSLKVNSLPYER